MSVNWPDATARERAKLPQADPRLAVLVAYERGETIKHIVTLAAALGIGVPDPHYAWPPLDECFTQCQIVAIKERALDRPRSTFACSADCFCRSLDKYEGPDQYLS